MNKFVTIYHNTPDTTPETPAFKTEQVIVNPETNTIEWMCKVNDGEVEFVAKEIRRETITDEFRKRVQTIKNDIANGLSREQIATRHTGKVGYKPAEIGKITAALSRYSGKKHPNLYNRKRK